MMVLIFFVVTGDPGRIDGDRDQNEQPANQHDGSSDVEAFSFLHSKKLHYKHDQGDKGEDDGQDHEGLDCLECREVIFLIQS